MHFLRAWVSLLIFLYKMLRLCQIPNRGVRNITSLTKKNRCSRTVNKRPRKVQQWCMDVWKKRGMELFATSTVRMKKWDHRHPWKCGHHSEGKHSYCEGPQRHLWSDFNHNNVELSLLRKKKRIRLTNRETERNWPRFSLICNHVHNRIKGVLLGFC